MDKGYVQNTIFELLSRLGIGYEKLEHSPIITMKEGSEIAYKLGSTSCKNLFLCNKRQEYFMLTSFPQLFYPLMTRQFFCDFHEKSEDFCVS